MSEMGRCRDCRWWTPIEIVTGGICRLASWANDAPKGAKANALGPNGFGPASLATAPDFGCVEFKARGT